MRFSFHAATQRRGDRSRNAPHLSEPLRLCVKIIGLLALTGPLEACLPRTPRLPMLSQSVMTVSTTIEAPALKRLLFGLGLGFYGIGDPQGVPITRVMPDSPAARAGLAVGCVVTEINGVVTVGRTGEDCARIIQNGFGPVRLKYLDAARQEKMLQIKKAWIAVPSLLLP